MLCCELLKFVLDQSIINLYTGIYMIFYGKKKKMFSFSGGWHNY